MSFLKAVTIITLWLVLSFFWVSMGQSQAYEEECHRVNLESLIKPHPVLSDWYRFCRDRNVCDGSVKDLLRIISNSETLSTKLNQASVRFDQIYSPLSRLIDSNLECLAARDLQDVQSDLSLIDDSLHRVLTKISLADADYLRAVVVLSQASDFVRAPSRDDGKAISVTRRLNRSKYHYKVDLPIHYKEIADIPYTDVFSLRSK